MPILAEAPLQRTSLREQALALLREALVSGRIADGVVYSSKALAAELGVSNGPVREAMLALVDDGLMEAVPNKGFRTVPLTEADLAEIYEMRLLLEVPVTARLARNGLPGDLAARLAGLVDTIERTARSRDLTGNLAADGDFPPGLASGRGQPPACQHGRPAARPDPPAQPAHDQRRRPPRHLSRGAPPAARRDRAP
jgi:DNA-binding GntR family transcriptional regulator